MSPIVCYYYCIVSSSMHFHIFVCNQYVLIIRSTLQKEYLDRTCHIIPRSRTHLCHVTFTIHADSAVNLTARRDASLKFCGRRFILVFLFSFSLNCTNSYVRSTQMYRVVYRVHCFQPLRGSQGKQILFEERRLAVH